MVGRVVRNPGMRLTVRSGTRLRVRRLMLKRECVSRGVRGSVGARMLGLLWQLRGVGVMLLLHDARWARVLKLSRRRTLLRMMWMMLRSLESVKDASSMQMSQSNAMAKEDASAVDVCEASHWMSRQTSTPGAMATMDANTGTGLGAGRLSLTRGEGQRLRREKTAVVGQVVTRG